MIPGGDDQRTLAYRFGVNAVIYALTGNYKTDQVHVPALLQRLGRVSGVRLSHLASLQFQPLLPVWLLWLLGLACAAATLLALLRRSGGAWWRGLAFALLLLWLGGPLLMRQDWRALPQTLLVAVDRSGSMEVGDRAAIASRAAAAIEAEARRIPGLGLRVVTVGSARRTRGRGSGRPRTGPDGIAPPAEGGTRLVGAIERAAAGIPAGEGGGRIAAIVAITDGEASDARPAPAGRDAPPFRPATRTRRCTC